MLLLWFFFFFQAEDGIRDWSVTGVQTCALPISFGKIATDWQRNGANFTLQVSIPVNTTAVVYIPTSDPASVTESGKAAEKAKGVHFLGREEGLALYTVGSGNYAFASQSGPR